jgi:TPR repeat protein
MGPNKPKTSSKKKRPPGEKRGGIPGAIVMRDSDGESAAAPSTNGEGRTTGGAPIEVDVVELLQRIRLTQEQRPNGWCEDVRLGIMRELAEFPGITVDQRSTSNAIAFDHAVLAKNYRVCDLQSRLAVIPIDDAIYEQSSVKAVTAYLAQPLDKSMVREALKKQQEGHRLAESRDKTEFMRRSMFNSTYPMEVTLWQVIAMECKVGDALYEFMAKRAELARCESDADKTRCERELVKAIDFLNSKAEAMADLGLGYAKAVDQAGDIPQGAHFARLASRCWRGCAMLYERGADMREYLDAKNRALRDVALDLRYVIASSSGNLGNMYFHGRLNDERNYGISYKDSRATKSQRALCIYFLEKGAEHGDYNAQHSLGKLIRARGGEANIRRAIELYKMGANNSNQVSTYACYQIGLEYMLPGSVHENQDEAIRYWRKGAATNDGTMGPQMCAMALRMGKNAGKSIVTEPELGLIGPAMGMF